MRIFKTGGSKQFICNSIWNIHFFKKSNWNIVRVHNIFLRDEEMQNIEGPKQGRGCG